MDVSANTSLVSIFSGEHYWNKHHWHFVWKTKDAPSLSIMIPRDSDHWKEDWASFVLFGRTGFTESYYPDTRVDCVPAQEIFCNTVLIFKSKDRLVLMESVSEHYTETQVQDVLRSISEDNRVRKLRLEFSAYLMDGGPREVFKSDRDRLRYGHFDHSLLVKDSSDSCLWQI
jgi:hypothetical protein